LERIVPQGTEDFPARVAFAPELPSVNPEWIVATSLDETHGCCSGWSLDIANQTTPTANPMNAHIQNE